MTKTTKEDHFAAGVIAGAGLFIGASWFLHCKCGLGPWKCQSTDPRHQANRAEGECSCGRAEPVRRRRRRRRAR